MLAGRGDRTALIVEPAMTPATKPANRGNTNTIVDGNGTRLKCSYSQLLCESATAARVLRADGGCMLGDRVVFVGGTSLNHVVWIQVPTFAHDANPFMKRLLYSTSAAP